MLNNFDKSLFKINNISTTYNILHQIAKQPAGYIFIAGL